MSEQNYEDNKEAEEGEDASNEELAAKALVDGNEQATNDDAAKMAAHESQEQAAVDELHDRAVAEAVDPVDIASCDPFEVLRRLANGEITREAAREYVDQYE